MIRPFRYAGGSSSCDGPKKVLGRVEGSARGNGTVQIVVKMAATERRALVTLRVIR